MAIFIDTNVFVAYYNQRDEHHKKAKRILKEIDSEEHGRVFTSDYIFDEAVTVVLVRTGKPRKAIKFGKHLLESNIRILKVNSYIFKKAWELFKERKMSFTDCTNLAFLQIFGIKKIATFDRAFEEESEMEVVS